MQETVMFAIIIIVGAFVASLLFYSYLEDTTYTNLAAISNITYHQLLSINNLQNSQGFSCTGPLETFTVTPQGIIEMTSFLSYKDAVSFSGGVPSKNIVYYSGSYLFIVAPYSIASGEYSNAEVCIIPSKISAPVLIVRQAID